MKRNRIILILITTILFLTGILLYNCLPYRKKTDIDLHAVIFHTFTTADENQNILKQISQYTQSALENYPRISVSSYEISNENYISMDYRIQAAIALKADAVILGGADDSQNFNDLKEAGIPFILVDGDVPGSGRAAYIGTNNLNVGKQAADIAASLEDSCQTAIVTPIKTPSSLAQRCEGFLSQAAEFENVSVLTECECSLDYSTAAENIQILLDQYPDINVLFCTDSVSGTAAMNIVKTRDQQGKVHIICSDLTQQISYGIEEDIIDAALIQDTPKIGQICARYLNQMRTGEANIGEEILVECQIVTKDNLEIYQNEESTQE